MAYLNKKISYNTNFNSDGTKQALNGKKFQIMVFRPMMHADFFKGCWLNYYFFYFLFIRHSSAEADKEAECNQDVWYPFPKAACSDSPIKSFTSISEAKDCLVDFKKQLVVGLGSRQQTKASLKSRKKLWSLHNGEGTSKQNRKQSFLFHSPCLAARTQPPN